MMESWLTWNIREGVVGDRVGGGAYAPVISSREAKVEFRVPLEAGAGEV